MTDFLLNNLDSLIAILLMLLFSLTLRFLMQLVGQRWVTTTSHTATLVFLPMLTFVITKVISGNIALSLGMVGALSIVRFRNPVRSPLELTLYFGAITMGIAASVSLKWLVFLMGATLLTIFILLLIQFLLKRVLNVNFFSYSFSEGNSQSTLVIKTDNPIESLENNNLLHSMIVNQDGLVYTFVSGDFEYLKSLSRSVNKNPAKISVTLTR